MAQAVTIQHGDTITKILKSRKGLQNHEIFAWKSRLNRLNPHIGNLDRIFPGDSILIPDTLNEPIGRERIWRNAFSTIPQALRYPYHGPTEIYFAQPGDTIDKVAQYMFRNGQYRTIAASSKRALLLHNNPFLKDYLQANRIPMNRLINITPAVLSEVEKKHWQLQRTPLKTAMDQMENDTLEMFKQVGETATTVEKVIRYFKDRGASVGMDDVVRSAGYGVAGVSGYAASGNMAIGTINTLTRELFNEAVEKLGAKVVYSTKANHLSKVQQFLKGHPKYDQLMRHLGELPKHLLPKTDFVTVNTRVDSAVARQFRKHISLPLKKWNSPAKYVGSMAKQLNGRLRVLKGVGRHATWYVPAALGVVSVATAPPEMRMRTLFEEGFGILGGAIGTMAGSAVAIGALGLLALCGLCLGPFGVFVAVFICATAGGILVNEIGRKIGGQMYDYSELRLNTGQIYHSPEQILLEAVK